MAQASTSVIEMEPVHLTPLPPYQQQGYAGIQQAQSRHSEEGAPALGPGGDPGTGAEVEVVERWNHPRSNMARVAACFWSFTVAGCNDAAYGVSLPSNVLTFGIPDS